MTIDELEEFKGMRAEVTAIRREIETLYAPISSPNGHTDGGHSTTPGNPTEHAAMLIMKRKATLETKVTEMQRRLERIESWLETVDDSKLRACIRWHYLNGLNWKQTNLRVFGYPNPYRARKKVMRYFEKNAFVQNVKSDF